MAEIMALLITAFFNIWFFAGYLGSGGSFPKPLTPEEEMYLKRMYEGDGKAREIEILTERYGLRGKAVRT